MSAADELRTMADYIPTAHELRDLAERFEALADELSKMHDAVLDACIVMGDDMSDGLPTWPPPHVLLVQRAADWRLDYDESLDGTP